jgi:hypothetical protein
MVAAETYAVARLKFIDTYPELRDDGFSVSGLRHELISDRDQYPLVPAVLRSTCDKCLGHLANNDVDWDARWFKDVAALTARYEAEADMRLARDSAAPGEQLLRIAQSNWDAEDRRRREQGRGPYEPGSELGDRR